MLLIRHVKTGSIRPLSYDVNRFVVGYIISKFVGREGQGCPPACASHGLCLCV